MQIQIQMSVLSVLSQNVVDALPCRRQSFHQVWYKLAVDCMKNTNKCQKKSSIMQR